MVIKRGFFGLFKSSTGAPASEMEDPDTPSSTSVVENVSRTTATTTTVSAFPDYPTPSSQLVTDQSISDDVQSFVREKLGLILEHSQFPSTLMITKIQDSVMFITIENEKDAGRIIGKDGANLDALQTLLGTFVYRKFSQNVRIVLDIAEYRKRRWDSLKKMAESAYQQAIDEDRKVELPPMNSSERRLVHMMFESHDRAKCYSVGRGRLRHIVVERI